MATLIKERDGFNPVVIKGHDDMLGIVTVHDGPSLAQGQIIAPTVGEDPTNVATYHNSFQDPERFLAGGGMRGRQYQVLVEGTYYINRLFATVELRAQDGHRGRQRRRRRVVHRRRRHGPVRRAVQARRAGAKGLRGVWSEASCRASTRSTRTPAR